jgi:hypothetical protein
MLQNMDCIMDYIGKDQATTLVQQYGLFEYGSKYKPWSSST